MGQQKVLFLITYLISAVFFLAGFRAPGESPTNFNDFVPVTIAVSLLHASDEEPQASHVQEAKAFSFAPVEQDEPNCDDNLPPSADAGGPYQATLVIGDPFPIIHFDASNSIDADGTIDEYLWEFGDDGVVVIGRGEAISIKYLVPEDQVANLTIIDNCGATGQDTAEVTIVPDLPYPPFNTDCTDADIAFYSENYDRYEFDRHALAACGAEVVPALISIVESESSDLQCEAAQALGRMGEEAETAIPTLTSLFRSGGCSDFGIIYSLANIGSAAVPVFIEALEDEDEDEDIRIDAARGLGEIGEDARDAVPALIEALNQEGSGIFKAAVARAIGSIGEDARDAVPALIEALNQEGSDYFKGSVALALGSIGGEDVVSALICALNQEGSDDFKVEVARALGSMGEDARHAVPTLVEALNQEGPGWFKANIAWALVKIGTVPKDAIPKLEQLFVTDHPSYAARQALVSIGSEAVPSLISLLKSDDANIRSEAAYALVLLGDDAEGAKDDLRLSITDQNPGVSQASAVALAQIDSEYAQSAPPELISGLTSDLYDFYAGYSLQDRAAAVLLKHMGEAGIEDLPFLVEIIDTCLLTKGLYSLPTRSLLEVGAPQKLYILSNTYINDETCRNAIKAVGIIGGSTEDARITDALIPTLAGILNDNETLPWLRSEVALTLGKIDQETDTIVPALIKASGDNDKDVRYNSLIALGMLGVDIDDLILELGEDLNSQNLEMQGRAALSLATIGPYAVPTLLTALDNENLSGQIGAAYALGNSNFSNREIVEALQEIVQDEENELELRRVAASSLQLRGQDTLQFFESHDVINPKNAICPVYLNYKERVYGVIVAVIDYEYDYEYDVLTGKCQEYLASVSIIGTEVGAGGEGIFARLFQIFGRGRRFGGGHRPSRGRR